MLTRHVVTKFAPDRLTVLHHYPASQGALARRCPDDPRFADRFEVFCGRAELANGYRELTDAAEQRERFERDQQQRMLQGKTLRPLDGNLLAALEHGLPDLLRRRGRIRPPRPRQHRLRRPAPGPGIPGTGAGQ
ncbi:MAG: amino acid--tRNA ligase-related protein [Woeseiaceae bacterium]|nr:amino acid--tRNA ligase-related protein [Woeseiaceae bacterium]